MASNPAPVLRGTARPASEAELGIAWWNAMTEQQRLEALRAADTACPADAWDHWRYGFSCEEGAHG
jgi:hypothetical protein